MSLNNFGSADKPIQNMKQDGFEVESYVEGLGDFVLECETPLTVAVQGNWGSGKTSIMYLLNEYLMATEKVETIWFNTWQFSQFNMDAQISVTFLKHLVKKLRGYAAKSSAGGRIDEIGKKLFKFTTDVATGVISNHFGSDIGTAAKNLAGIDAEKDLSDEILDLKENFQQIINEVTKNGEKRVVIFVDDLDRLQPIHAIELLEVLKIFVDCENCIFVLAIDTSVVFQGIKAKYGDISSEKAQSFFDKIIQLPFNMPTANYKLETMIFDMFSLDMDNMSGQEIREYIELIKMTSDGNPRSIKRIANYYRLTDRVANRRHIYDDITEQERVFFKKILLAFSCIELRYPKIYEHILSRISVGMIVKMADMKLPKSADSNPYEIICNSLTKMAFPVYESKDGEACDKFARVISIFVKNCQDFIVSDGTFGSNQKEKLVSLLSLTRTSSVVNGYAEDNVQHAAETFSNVADSDIYDKLKIDENQKVDTIRRLMMDGKAVKAHRELILQGVYVPFSRIKDFESDDNEAKRYSSEWSHIVLKDHKLINYINEKLGGSYNVEITPYIMKLHIEDKFDWLFSLSLNSGAEIDLDYNKKFIDKDCALFGDFCKFIEEENRLFSELGRLYGSIIIREENFTKGVKPQYVDDELIGYGTRTDDNHMMLPLASTGMADCFIGFALNNVGKLKEIVEEYNNKDFLKRKSGAFGKLLDAAELAGKV